MMKFTGEKGMEISGTFANGETWTVKSDANGAISTKDEQIEAALLAAASHPDSGIKVAKGKD
jgi:hypothetical protein